MTEGVGVGAGDGGAVHPGDCSGVGGRRPRERPRARPGDGAMSLPSIGQRCKGAARRSVKTGSEARNVRSLRWLQGECGGTEGSSQEGRRWCERPIRLNVREWRGGCRKNSVMEDYCG
ncbi:hypothetical protein MTO96_039991 [Rhipicephalus appendiculatus]